MRKRIEDLVELQKAIDNEETIVNESGKHLIGSNAMPVNLFTGGLMINLYVKEPDPEPPRYVYRKLVWDASPYVKVYIYGKNGNLLYYYPLNGLVHYHYINNRKYLLVGFTSSTDDKEEHKEFPYYANNDKKKYARFELQPTEVNDEYRMF